MTKAIRGKMHSPALIKNEGDGVASCIDKEDLLAINLERQRRLLCKSGLLWVTIQGDNNDYLLGDEREMQIPRSKKVLIEAEKPSCFQID
ncbi:MAG: DUF2917 domain-containing protein [Spirochaetales bacterium]